MKRNRMAIVAALFLISTAAFAQERPTQDVAELCKKYGPEFTALETWLEGNHPLYPGDTDRQRELQRIDAALLEPDAKFMPCVGDYFRQRLNAFIKDFRSKKVTRGFSVWKLYNHQVIIKTPKVTIAVDIFPGFSDIKYPPEILNEIIDSVDVFLVTHGHGDHITPEIARMFLEKGKTVIAPTGMWQPKGAPRDTLDGIVYVRNAELKFPGATIRSIASFQKETPDNIYLITTDDGYTAMHTGDMNTLLFQSGKMWYRELKKPMEIDLLIPNCWSPDLKVMEKTVHAKLILSSHEHELGHPVSGRRPYSYVYGALGVLKTPFIVPAWGERFDWPEGYDNIRARSMKELM